MLISLVLLYTLQQRLDLSCTKRCISPGAMIIANASLEWALTMLLRYKACQRKISVRGDGLMQLSSVLQVLQTEFPMATRQDIEDIVRTSKRQGLPRFEMMEDEEWFTGA